MKKLKTVFLPLLLCGVLLLTSCGAADLLAQPGRKLDEVFNPLDMNTVKEPAFVDYSVSRLLYESLNEKEKQAYRRIYNTVFEHPSKILLPLMTEEELSRVFLALKFDNPQLLCLRNTYTYYISGSRFYILPEYNCSAGECALRNAELAGAARDIFSGLEAGAGEYERELYLHDALINAVDYYDGDDSDTAYGALVKHKAACGGYALACKLLFDMAGISSAAISGNALASDGGKRPHMWLAASIENEWYFVDPAWDDPLNDFGESVLRHTYFNITDDRLSLTHSDYTLPESISCVSEACDYYVKSGHTADSENWTEKLSELLNGVRELPAHTELRFETAGAYAEARKKLFDDGGVSEMLADIAEKYGDITASHSFDDDREIIHIYIKQIKKE